MTDFCHRWTSSVSSVQLKESLLLVKGDCLLKGTVSKQASQVPLLDRESKIHTVFFIFF